MDRYGADRSGFAALWLQFIYIAPTLTMFGEKKLEKSKGKSGPDQFLKRGVER
jgi:hypothetical protein